MSAIQQVVEVWDRVVDAFLDGKPDLPIPLDRWFGAYRGRGLGAVDFEALPEPYLGDLHGIPRAVFLALNPGPPDHALQARGGAFAEDIRRLGSYGAWAKTWPYLIDGGRWEQLHGVNRHHRTRLTFLRRWFGDASLGPADKVGFELYPWHSFKVMGTMRPDPAVVREYVWDPIAELGQPVIFAFGKPWFALLPGLGVEIVDRLGAGGRPYGSRVPGRAVLMGRTTAGSLVIAEKHPGSAGPPAADEAVRLRQAIQNPSGN